MKKRMQRIIKSPYLYYCIIAFIVLGPALLSSGYIFLLDMPWPDNFDLSDYTESGIAAHLPITAFFWLLSFVVPTALIQKLLLLSILIAAPVGMYRLWQNLALTPKKDLSVYAFIAGLLYLLNPFVAERLLAGQWLVLAGYAFAPYVLTALQRVVVKGDRKSWLQLAFLYALSPILSLHWWYMITPVIVITLLAHIKPWQHKHLSRKTAIKSLQYAAAFLLLHNYWLLSLASKQGEKVQQSDFSAFTTLGDPVYGVLLNVITLYGFWNDRVFLPKDFFEPWLLIGVVFAALTVLGATAVLQRTPRKRSLVGTVLVAAIVPTIIVAIGYGSGVTRPIIDVLQYLPGFTGMRDTAKYVGLLALITAVFAPLGIRTIANWEPKLGSSLPILMIAVIIVSMNGMAWGVRSQLTGADYPSGWYSVNNQLTEAPEGSRALVLPWQGYLDVTFANNQYIANPSRVFFDIPISQSSFTGNRLLVRDTTALDQLVVDYPRLEDERALYDWFDELKENHAITHIILLKTDNWQFYERLNTLPEVVFSDSDISLLDLTK